MVEALAASLGLTVAMTFVVAIVATLLFPAFWLWMLVDSLVREPAAYPGSDSNEKLLWVLVMVFFQPGALLYFWLVWRAGRQRTAPAAAYAA